MYGAERKENPLSLEPSDHVTSRTGLCRIEKPFPECELVLKDVLTRIGVCERLDLVWTCSWKKWGN